MWCMRAGLESASPSRLAAVSLPALAGSTVAGAGVVARLELPRALFKWPRLVLPAGAKLEGVYPKQGDTGAIASLGLSILRAAGAARCGVGGPPGCGPVDMERRARITAYAGACILCGDGRLTDPPGYQVLSRLMVGVYSRSVRGMYSNTGVSGKPSVWGLDRRLGHGRLFPLVGFLLARRHLVLLGSLAARLVRLRLVGALWHAVGMARLDAGALGADPVAVVVRHVLFVLVHLDSSSAPA